MGMEDLNDIFKEPEEGDSVIIGNWRWNVRDGRASCVYIGEDKPKDHKNYFENMSREDLIEAIECGANNITLLQDERDVAQDRCKELENGLKEVREYVRFINPAHYSSENEIKILEIIDKVLEGKK